MTSEILQRATEIRTIAKAQKPVETFWLDRDPITGERFDTPTYRTCIPVYDAQTGELREFLP